MTFNVDLMSIFNALFIAIVGFIAQRVNKKLDKFESIDSTVTTLEGQMKILLANSGELDKVKETQVIHQRDQQTMWRKYDELQEELREIRNHFLYNK